MCHPNLPSERMTYFNCCNILSTNLCVMNMMTFRIYHVYLDFVSGLFWFSSMLSIGENFLVTWLPLLVFDCNHLKKTVLLVHCRDLPYALSDVHVLEYSCFLTDQSSSVFIV